MLNLLEATSTGLGQFLIEEGVRLRRVKFFAKSLDKYKLSIDVLNSGLVFNIEDINRIIDANDDTQLFWSNSDAGLDYILNDKILSSFLPNRKLIDMCRNKKLFRSIFPDVSPQQIYSYKNIVDFESNKVIKKPINGSGSTNISIHKKKDIDENYFHKNLNDPLYITEEYIEGDEYSAEVIVNKYTCLCIGIFKKILTAEPKRLELMHLPQVSVDNQDVLIDFCSKLSSYITHGYSILHVEFKLLQGKLYIMEVNPRPCGSLLAWSLPIKINDFAQLVLNQFEKSLSNQELPPNKISAPNRFVVSTLSPDHDKFIREYILSKNINIVKSFYNLNYKSNASNFSGRFSTYCLDLMYSLVSQEDFVSFFKKTL